MQVVGGGGLVEEVERKRVGKRSNLGMQREAGFVTLKSRCLGEGTEMIEHQFIVSG